MSNIHLSVIVPTTGRTSLSRTLESITSQLLPGDEIIVRFDASGDWGATPRMACIRAATGTHLLFMDDDDVYLGEGLTRVRSALARQPDRPHMFCMTRGGPHNDSLWTHREVVEGNVSTQMFVVPNDPQRLGKWGTRYACDFDFITSTLALYPPDALVWSAEVIAAWRPA